MRSHGSSSRGTIARCHALGKAMQLALGRKGFYVIEVISKRFDKLPNDEKIKVLIHELMHIPKSFGGGFRHHDFVCEENIEIEFQKYINYKRRESNNYENIGLNDINNVSKEINEVRNEIKEPREVKKSWW